MIKYDEAIVDLVLTSLFATVSDDDARKYIVCVLVSQWYDEDMRAFIFAINN